MSLSPLDNAAFGLFFTHSLHLADKHGIFSHLIQSGPSSATEIATSRKIDPETTERLLVVLAALSVLERDGAGTYGIPSELAPRLDADDPRYIGGFVSHLATNTTEQIHKLDAYLTHGKAAVDAELPDPFAVIYRDESSVAAFLEAMWQLSYEPSKEIADLARLASVRHLVDVGGASGAFGVAALAQYPGLQVTVFDLPEVEPHLVRTADRHQLSDRLHFVAGDFFKDPLPAADCLSFGYILSDWEDEVCLELLTKAYQACEPNGRVMVMERLFDDDGGPLPTAVMNLSMHVETRGRHRTAAEYTELLVKAGFADCSTHHSSWDKHLVTGRKP
ncbi:MULTISPECIES: methyltransferase [unclassified Streptomyces]|uniref:methyltransferase n=1 Tax=unclassified Streptomyces TaxID=2593676 RepID=UPI0035DBA8E0